jgi:SPP1 gp7 family putative phage head morphogenesis protein
MADPIKATVDKDGSVIYEYADGRRERWSGGSKAWRTHNPGNIFYDNSNNWKGQLGTDGRSVIFSTPELGHRAIHMTLVTKGKKGRTLAEGIASYAPPNENNTSRYIKNVETWSGISRLTPLKDLSDKQIEDVVNAIIRQEGTKTGKVRPLNPDGSEATGKYIWNTQGDDKVRDEHAAREGEMFDFDNPPEGGAPGEDYNCRCWAAPVAQVALSEVFKK